MDLITHRAVLHCTQTQTELCKKNGTLLQEFARLRQFLLHDPQSHTRHKYKKNYLSYHHVNYFAAQLKQALNNIKRVEK